MADDVSIKDAAGATVTIRAKEISAGVKAWHQCPLGTDSAPLENAEGTALSSGARTTQTDSADFINNGKSSLLLAVKVTASTTAVITPSLQWKNPVTGDYNTIWTAAAGITAAATYLYRLGPGNPSDLTAFAETADCPIPRTFRLRMLVADATSITYSVAYALMV